jgi:hypothetical protein
MHCSLLNVIVDCLYIVVYIYYIIRLTNGYNTNVTLTP